jgi:hypothetical protein
MKPIVQGLGVCIAVILALGLSSSFAAGARAQADPSTVIIHKAECPAGYTGDNYFDDCHGNAVPGVTFQWASSGIGTPQEVTTDENGAASFNVSDPGLGMTIVEEDVGSLAKYVVYCSKNDGAEALHFNYTQDEAGILIPTAVLAVGDSVVCDWYNIPPAAQDGGSQSTPSESVPGETVTLPATGTGSGRMISHGEWVPIALVVLLLLVGGVVAGGFQRHTR